MPPRSPHPPQTVSSLEPYRAVVLRLHADGVEGTAILLRLREQGYTGTVSSLYRFLRQLHPAAPDTPVRLERAPGEEAQVDFGYAGHLLDPTTGARGKAWAFVMLLAWSRHMYVKFVFDQRMILLELASAMTIAACTCCGGGRAGQSTISGSPACTGWKDWPCGSVDGNGPSGQRQAAPLTAEQPFDDGRGQRVDMDFPVAPAVAVTHAAAPFAVLAAAYVAPIGRARGNPITLELGNAREHGAHQASGRRHDSDALLDHTGNLELVTDPEQQPGAARICLSVPPAIWSSPSTPWTHTRG